MCSYHSKKEHFNIYYNISIYIKHMAAYVLMHSLICEGGGWCG